MSPLVSEATFPPLHYGSVEVVRAWPWGGALSPGVGCRVATVAGTQGYVCQNTVQGYTGSFRAPICSAHVPSVPKISPCAGRSGAVQEGQLQVGGAAVHTARGQGLRGPVHIL